MANSFFKFKQFTINQDACAMKVTTDACLFGAWCANLLNSVKPNNILDIGSGTGLLSLMLAQKSAAAIDSVEININAFNQAKQNIESSSFKSKISVHHSSIQQYSTTKKYDFIICNPPFFEQDLLSNNIAKNMAMHHTTLQLTTLVQCINKLITENGFFAVLLPFHRTNYFEELTPNFKLLNKTIVQHSAKHPPFRTMFLFSKAQANNLYEECICIKEISLTQYTPAFITLLKPYYLYL
ncbi:MAG: methyltransferase [Chitinophagaceae bacterium]|nr:methyltransferase [Chitinophagaceae bacterium]